MNRGSESIGASLRRERELLPEAIDLIHKMGSLHPSRKPAGKLDHPVPAMVRIQAVGRTLSDLFNGQHNADPERVEILRVAVLALQYELSQCREKLDARS